MTKKIELSADLSLPLDIVTQTIVLLAKRRAGKSYTMRRIVEQLFHAGQQIVVVDPKGDQWGMRSSANGKDPGLPIVILGGERGDIPLEVSGGELVAKLVVEQRTSVLLDLSLFRKGEVATFMTAFLENLYRLKAREMYRTPLMLVIDEADAIAPQKPQEGEERMLGAAEDIVRRGGQRGLGCILVTQRSAVLNKNVLTQAQMLVALRTISPQDLKAMNEWINVHGEPEQRKMLMESLPSLPVGDAWFWSPGWPTVDGIFQRIHVAPIETFDSGATPKPGEKRIEPKQLADVDMDALRTQMAATIERAKADDPKELKKRIAELQREAAKTKPAPVVEDKAAIAKAVKEATRELVAENRVLRSRIAAIAGIAPRLRKLVVDVEEECAIAISKALEQDAPQPAAAPRPVLVRTPPPAKPKRQASGSSDVKLPAGEHRILTAIAQYDDGVTREQLTVLTGYKRSTRDAYVQRLREKELVAVDRERVTATDAGIEALGDDFELLPTGEALRDHWMGRLPAGERAILEVLVGAYPASVDRGDLETATGFKRSTRDAYLQRMQSKRLVTIEGRGAVRASEVLFG